MDFDSFLEAQEQAFAGEKEDFIDRIEKLKHKWEESIVLDEEAIKLIADMNILKRLVCRGNFQILRIKEECLQSQLANSLLKFHVRQLQKELLRLVPQTTSNVPSTEFHMSLDRAVYKEVTQRSSEPDGPLFNELKNLKYKWIELNQLLNQVLKEESDAYQADVRAWQEFMKAFNQQNQDAHHLIDTQLTEVAKNLFSIRSVDEQFLAVMNSDIKKMENRIKRLKVKKNTALVELETKHEQRFKRLKRLNAKQNRDLHRRVEQIENRKNLNIETLQDENKELQEQRDNLTEEVLYLREDIKSTEQKNKRYVSRGEKRISDLEAEFNVLVSAAVSVQNISDTEHQKILNAMASAINIHARSTQTAEELSLKISHMKRQLKRITSESILE